MYQRVSRWLRVLGYDSIADPNYSDDDFLAIAKRENRVVITRDDNLINACKKREIKAVKIDGTTVEERLVKLSKQTEVELFFSEKELPRCTVCNSEIKAIDKEKIQDRLQEGTKKNYSEFWMCKNKECQQIFWKGPHWERMEKSLEECRKLIEQQK